MRTLDNKHSYHCTAREKHERNRNYHGYVGTYHGGELENIRPLVNLGDIEIDYFGTSIIWSRRDIQREIQSTRLTMDDGGASATIRHCRMLSSTRLV